MSELRLLTMEKDQEVNEDEWFIENLKEIPRPKNSKEYDYMQFDRFISKITQRKLIEIPIMPTKYLNELKTKITGGTGEVLLDIHFHEPKDSPDKILNQIIQLF